MARFDQQQCGFDGSQVWFDIVASAGFSLVKAHVVGGFRDQEVKAGLRLLLRFCQESSFLIRLGTSQSQARGLGTSHQTISFVFCFFFGLVFNTWPDHRGYND